MTIHIDIWAVLFLTVMVLGVLSGIALWRWENPPIRVNARTIFRVVHREDRAAYVRMMRRTYAVVYRDMGRNLNKMQREIGKALLPPLRRMADEMNRFLRSE